MVRQITTLPISLSMVAATGQAQVLYGSIVGNVNDSSDAPIPGAMVAIRNVEMGPSRETATNDAGGYSFSDVSSGTYEVRVSRHGFTSVLRTNVPVTINNISRVNVSLQVGSVTESVQVSAQAAILQTDRSEVRAEVTTKSLENLPVPPGRNYQQIFRTLPGFSPPRQRSFHSVESDPRAHIQCERYEPEFEQHTHRWRDLNKRSTALGVGICPGPRIHRNSERGN
jgi:hypothetical protein